MATQTNLEQPTLVLRRVLDALTDAEPLPSRRPRVRSVGPRAEVTSFLIRSTRNVMVPPISHPGTESGPTTSMLNPAKSSIRRVVATAHRVGPMCASTRAPGGSRRLRASKISPANPTIGPTPPAGALIENAGFNFAVLPFPGQRTDWLL